MPLAVRRYFVRCLVLISEKILENQNPKSRIGWIICDVILALLIGLMRALSSTDSSQFLLALVILSSVTLLLPLVTAIVISYTIKNLHKFEDTVVVDKRLRRLKNLLKSLHQEEKGLVYGLENKLEATMQIYSLIHQEKYSKEERKREDGRYWRRFIDAELARAEYDYS